MSLHGTMRVKLKPNKTSFIGTQFITFLQTIKFTFWPTL